MLSFFEEICALYFQSSALRKDGLQCASSADDVGPKLLQQVDDEPDIGFASIRSNALSSGVVWLTTTSGNEADSTIAAWKPSGDSTEQYVVGWLDGAVYRLGRVNATGMFLEGPLDATAKAVRRQRGWEEFSAVR